jgi:LAO/AO transport system kinase
VENRTEASHELLKGLFAYTGQARVVGLTGAPGAGKSTLVDSLAREYRKRQQSVGIIAIDPTSPFTGGAILGDRIRMQSHSGDDGTFIRSMATRGSLGGLSSTTADVATVLDAAGRQVVMIETVGVGQDEVDIVRLADVTIVILVPGMGDDVQSIKAGIMEIADIFVINKADRPGAREARRDLEQMLDLSTLGAWRPPIVDTIASSGEGLAALWDEIARHRAHLRQSGELEQRRAERLGHELRRVLMARSAARIDELASGEEFAGAVKALAAGELDPYQAADRLLER